MKTIYFLCGLPRAGNTLLASILNQNQKISVTANSLVPDIFFSLEKVKNVEGYSVFPDEKSLENISNNVFQNYYSHWEANYILDRSSWGLPHNLKYINQYCHNEVKIILLLRNVENVLSSFIKWSEENKNSFLNKFESLDEKCNFLMRDNGLINLSLQSCYNIFQSEYNFKLIEYDNLVENTEMIIDEVYSFLDIPKYKHQFTNLNQFSTNGILYNDKYLGDNLHHIKTDSVKRPSYDIEKYLPKQIIDRVSQYNFWK